MIYIPRKNNKPITVIFLLGILLLFVIFIICQYGIIVQVYFHFTFFIEAIFYCFLLTKYILPIYEYKLLDDRFVITKTVGSKTVTVCDIDFCKIEKIVTKKEYKKENADLKSVYNYNANFPAFSSYCLIFSYSNCREALLFEPDKTMVNEIEKIISERLLSF